jgi:hypothetical protein
MSVTVYNANEYNVLLDMPTDNFVVHKFVSRDTENMTAYLDALKSSIQNPDQLIVLLGVFANLREFDHWVDPLNQLANSIANKIVVFNGNLSPYDGDTKFHYFKLSIFDHISNIFWKENLVRTPYDWQTVPSERQHKFYWASTKDLYPRRYLLSQLIKNDLLTGNLVNYKCIVSNVPSDYMNSRFDKKYHDMIEQECASIQHLIPLPHLDDTIEFNQTDRRFYLDSYLGIITDTFYDNDIFLSEKVFNAMHYYQIFAYLGPAHTLKYLQARGYMTFGDIIDETYDDIEDHAERLITYTHSLTEFLTQSRADIRAAYIRAIPRLQHNKAVLDAQRPDRTFTKLIQGVI